MVENESLSVFGGETSSSFAFQRLAVFEGKKIRKVWNNEEWWFSVVDIVGTLTDSDRARKYWSDLKVKLIEEGFQLSDFVGQLKLESSDGKSYETDCTNTEGAFRIIQSIPSPKAEPFKLWLAKVGYDRVKEIENPELAQTRMRELYRKKGYSEDWIEKRVRGIIIRQELTDEWKKRSVGCERDYAILTNEISKATFGKTVEEYKEFKNLKKQNLRDHMNDLELIFNMLGERATAEIARKKDANGFGENKVAANKGGKIAGDARKNLEVETGASVMGKENYLQEPEKEKRKRLTSK